MQRAIVIVDHGSRRREANALVEEIAASLGARIPDHIVRHAHMELEPPSLADSVAECVAEGAREIAVHPYFLGPGNHTSDDIPRLAREAAATHPGVSVMVTPPIGPHPLLEEIVLERVREVLP